MRMGRRIRRQGLALVTLTCLGYLIIWFYNLHLSPKRSPFALTNTNLLRSTRFPPSKDSVSPAVAVADVTTFSRNGSAPHSNTPSSTKSSDLKNSVLGSGLPLLTLFSTWSDPAYVSLVRNLTLRNWAQLGPQVTPLLFTNDTGTAAQARRYGWHTLPVSKTAVGVPILKYMFLDAMKSFNSTLYAYANGDLLFTDGLMKTLVAILQYDSLPVSQKRTLFMVGRRTNVPNVTEQEALNFHNVSVVGRTRGKLFLKSALDLFISDRQFPWDKIPDLVIGRIRYDSWLVMYANRNHHVIIDITETAPSIHQTTKAGDYEHRLHPNVTYNAILLRKLYNVKSFAAGTVECTPWQTVYTSDGEVVVQNRKKMKKKGC